MLCRQGGAQALTNHASEGSGNAAAPLHEFNDLDLPSLEDIILHHEAADSSITGIDHSSSAAPGSGRPQPGLEWPTPTQALGFCHPAFLDDAEPVQPERDLTGESAVPKNQQQQQFQGTSAYAFKDSLGPQQQDGLSEDAQQAAQSSQQASNQEELGSAPPSPQLLSLPNFIQAVSDRQALAFSTQLGSAPPGNTMPQQAASGPANPARHQPALPAGQHAIKSSPPGSPVAESGDLSAADPIPMGRKTSLEPESAPKAGQKRARPRGPDAANRTQAAAIKGQGAGSFGVKPQPEPQCNQPVHDGMHGSAQESGTSNCSGSSHKTSNPGQPQEDEAKREVRV